MDSTWKALATSTILTLVLAVGLMLYSNPVVNQMTTNETVNITINRNTSLYVPIDVDALMKELWGNEYTVIKAIAMAESHMRADAIGDKHLAYEIDGKVYGISVGLLQIRLFEDRPPMEWLLDPINNIMYAHMMFVKEEMRGRDGFKQWSAYKNGSYKKFLPVFESETFKERSTV